MDEYFHYHGSLTTGTCDEAVNWMVFKVIVAIGQLFSQFHRISQFCCFLLTKYHQKHSRCQNFVHASWLICRLTLEVSFVIVIVTLLNFSQIEKRENHIFFNVTESSCCDDKRSESTSDNQVSAKFTFVSTFWTFHSDTFKFLNNYSCLGEWMVRL